MPGKGVITCFMEGMALAFRFLPTDITRIFVFLVPSQVVNTMKSLKNKKNLMTIVTKIAMQINVKMDGTLWNVQIPVSL